MQFIQRGHPTLRPPLKFKPLQEAFSSTTTQVSVVLPPNRPISMQKRQALLPAMTFTDEYKGDKAVEAHGNTKLHVIHNNDKKQMAMSLA